MSKGVIKRGILYFLYEFLDFAFDYSCCDYSDLILFHFVLVLYLSLRTFPFRDRKNE